MKRFFILAVLFVAPARAALHEVSCAVFDRGERVQVTVTVSDEELRLGQATFKLAYGDKKAAINELKIAKEGPTRIITRWGPEVGIQGRFIINSFLQTPYGDIQIKKTAEAKFDKKISVITYQAAVTSGIRDFIFSDRPGMCYYRTNQKQSAQ